MGGGEGGAGGCIRDKRVRTRENVCVWGGEGDAGGCIRDKRVRESRENV